MIEPIRRRLAGARWSDPLLLLELFLVSNVAFLAVDIAMAHAINAFANPLEWVPIAFSVAGAAILLVAMVLGGPVPTLSAQETGRPGAGRRLVARWLGFLVGAGAVVVGVAGVILHLDSQFFEDQTLKSLVYTAPFAAPLAYAGVGLLLILDRMVDSRTVEWARWVVLMALGGFVGNFVLTLADHAQNGFFAATEWIGVVAAALAVGFLTAVVVVVDNRPLLRLCGVVLGLQGAVGVLGFGLHVAANLARPAASLWDRFLYGAPAFAPL
ncbi:MAG TPA: hypothetical protein VF590_05220, partial [Isosphaeraceae bacterium]